jgi:hypothetical protein
MGGVLGGAKKYYTLQLIMKRQKKTSSCILPKQGLKLFQANFDKYYGKIYDKCFSLSI